jgi:hypothetical protein
MKLSARALLILSVGTLSSCRLPTDESLISAFRAEPDAFDSFSSATQIRYTLSRSAATTLSIIARDGTRLRLFSNLSESRGPHEHTWLGEGSDGYFAPAGTYTASLEAEGERVETIIRIFHR